MRCLFDVREDGLKCPARLFKGYKIKQKASGSIRVANKKNNRFSGRIEAKTEVLEGKVTLDLPIRTVSESNCFEPWRKKHARHKEQKRIVALFLSPLRPNIRLPCHVMLTRFAPAQLDVFDNLPTSFKFIVDSLCSVITGDKVAGRADSDERITLACTQVKSKAYGVRIEITWE